MTVAELKQALEPYPDDADVMLLVGLPPAIGVLDTVDTFWPEELAPRAFLLSQGVVL